VTLDQSGEPCEIRIPARLQYVSSVRRVVMETARRAGLSQVEAGDLLLAVSEACNNAIQHGAGNIPGAEITVRIFTEPGGVHVEVSDPGAGFDPGALWEPRSETPHGRGMLLMMQLTDKVEYTSDGHGTTVKLSKHACTGEEWDAEDGSGRPGGRRRNRLRYVFDVCRTVSGTLELPRILAVVAERTARLFGVARARVLLHDPQRRTATVAASWGERVRVRTEAATTPATRQAIYVAGEETQVGDLEPRPESEVQGHVVRSSISVPIVSRGEVVGSIHLDNFQRRRRFTNSDVMALRAIAAQAAVAIENARLYREAQRHVEELAAIGEVAHELNASLDLDHTLQTILDKTKDLLGIEVCAVMLLDAEGYLSVRASCGMTDEYIGQQRALLEESPLARAITERRVIAAWDLRSYDASRGVYGGVVSAAAAPMMLHDRPIGTLNIYTRERYRFSEDQLRVLRALADHAALAVHNAGLYETSQHARAQLETSMARTGSALHVASELHEVIRLVAELAAQALGMDGGALVLTDMGILAGAGEPSLTSEDAAAVRALQDLASEVATNGEPLALGDVRERPQGHILRPAGIASFLAVPLATQEGLRGTLCVYARVPRALGGREVALLRSFAGQAAIVIENQRLLQDTNLRLEELGTLLEVGQSLLSRLDLEVVLDRIIEHVSRIMHAQVCSILLVDRDAGDLYVAASRGLDVRHAGRLRMPYAEGVIGTVLRDGCPRAIADIRRHSEFVYQDITAGQGLRALLCVPLATPTEVLGVLNVYRTTVHQWSDTEIKFLSALATQAAIAIQNATLYQHEQQVAQALQKAFVPARPPAGSAVEIGRVYVPAGEHAQVGGDYYDFIPLENGRLGIVIADVSGKGLRAATATAMGKYVLRAYVLENPAPGDAVVRTNHALCHQLQEDGAFLTLFYALWDPRACRLTYVNAGHPHPFLWRRATGECVPLCCPRTMLLGILADAQFAEKSIDIAPGDVLLAFTDGVSESRRGRELFGKERIRTAFEQVVNQPAQVIADEIYRSVCEFRDGSAVDDITVLVVRFGGRPA